MNFKLGIKSDPIEYRYSFPWLFRLMAEEGVCSLQLGSFFEMFQMPDTFFVKLRREAEDFGISIDSLFTAHRELGGFFREDPDWARVARRNYERFIEIGALLGAKSVGSNPGAVPRDKMGLKAEGTRCYVQHMKELMAFAHQRGVDWLTIEPMSCLAEPPTLPDEISAMAEELTAFHEANTGSTARVGYCTDIAHGYLNQQGKLGYDNVQLFEATLPYLYELHLKNTDERYHSTFGFDEVSLEKGIVDVAHFRRLLIENSKRIPTETMGAYLEIGGPKHGRDYTDCRLDEELRTSIRYLKKNFLQDAATADSIVNPAVALPVEISSRKAEVVIAPSVMCVDPLNVETAVRRLEKLGAGMLHMDVMDGHFVPNVPMGLSVIESICQRTHLPVDVHLMVEANDFFVGLLDGWKVHQISVHAEACKHLDRTLTRIREQGAKAGVALNPSTPLGALDCILERIDYVLLMTVNPGFAGQKMTPASLRKISECRAYLDVRGCEHISIQVDGNVSFENIPEMVAAGAQNLVVGTSSIFSKTGSLPENWDRIQSAVSDGLAARLEKSVSIA